MTRWFNPNLQPCAAEPCQRPAAYADGCCHQHTRDLANPTTEAGRRRLMLNAARANEARARQAAKVRAARLQAIRNAAIEQVGYNNMQALIASSQTWDVLDALAAR